MVATTEVVLEDGAAFLMAAEPGGAAFIDFHQEDLTISDDLGTSRTQQIMLETLQVQSLLMACRSGSDWDGGDAQAMYMGDDLMLVAQVDEEASMVRSAATIYQRIALSAVDLEAALTLAASPAVLSCGQLPALA